MLSLYKYLIVSSVFPTSDFGVGIFFLIAPFPDLCLLVPFWCNFVQDKYISKKLKIKLNLLKLKHGVQRSHLEACSLKKCTLIYTNFVFKCLVLYFGIKNEELEKSLNSFPLAVKILKLLETAFHLVMFINCYKLKYTVSLYRRALPIL